MLKNQRGIGVLEVLGIVIAAVVILTAVIWFYLRAKSTEPLSFDTPYQAVLLTNGAVYFGRLEGYGTRFPMLRDVYYVQTGTDPATKQTTNVLIKRGKELHGPDRMFLNERHIIMIEPVGTNSKVAQLIADDKNKH